MLLKTPPLYFVLILIGICAAAVLLSDQTEAKTWYVDDDGGADFEKIQDAVDAAGDGDTIRVFGTYYEDVIVNKTVSLVGNGSARTTIDGGGVGNVVRIVVDWVNISRFTMTGSNYGSGIRLGESSTTTITNNTISNNNNGIVLSSSSNTIITGNTISNNNQGMGGSSNNAIIMDNNITANNYRGISLTYSNNNTITGNTITSNNGSGIYLYNLCSKNTITGNTISNNNNGIVLSSFTYPTITSNTIISNNTISNNNNGIVLRSSKDFTITGNTIANNTISNNTEYGINAKSNNKYTINATHNWWGEKSGPYHPRKNPTGKGNNVSDYVDFSPWRDEEGNEVYVPPNEKDKKDSTISGLSILLFLIVLVLCLLVVVVRLPDSSFKRPTESSVKEKQLPPQPLQRINTCPLCGGKFGATSEKHPIIFNCHFCGKEIEFK